MEVRKKLIGDSGDTLITPYRVSVTVCVGGGGEGWRATCMWVVVNQEWRTICLMSAEAAQRRDVAQVLKERATTENVLPGKLYMDLHFTKGCPYPLTASIPPFFHTVMFSCCHVIMFSFCSYHSSMTSWSMPPPSLPLIRHSRYCAMDVTCSELYAQTSNAYMYMVYPTDASD